MAGQERPENGKKGARVMMKTGLIDWKTEAGMLEPKIVRSVSLSAKRLSVPPDCSKPIQKTMENRLMITMTEIRCQSTLVNGS